MALPSSANNGISLLEVDESPTNLSSSTTQMVIPNHTVLEHNDSYKLKLNYYLFKSPFIPPTPPDYKIPLRQIHSIASKLVALYSTIPLSRSAILSLWEYLWTNHFTAPFTKNFPTNLNSNAPKSRVPPNTDYRFGVPSVYARLVKTISATETSEFSPLPISEIINLHRVICKSITNCLTQTAEISSRPSSRQGRSLRRLSISSRSPSPSPSFTADANHTSNVPLPYQLHQSFQNSFIVLTSVPSDKDWDSQIVSLVLSDEIKSLLLGDDMGEMARVGCLGHDDLDRGIVIDAEERGDRKWMSKEMTLRQALEFVVDLESKLGGDMTVKEDGTFYEEV